MQGGLDLDEKLEQLLADLGEALIEAISDSSGINESLRELQQAGYSLYLVVDSKGGGKRRSREDRVRRAVADARTRTGNDPVFKIDGKDLHFLRSIGIDPTRKSRGRRSS